MKKVYNIPSTETIAFQSGFICNSGSPAEAGVNVGGGTLGGGTEVPGGTTIDPM
jgi:hypothetical protein